MRGVSALIFLRDRLLYILVFALIIGVFIVLMLLEKERNPGFIDLNTIYYFIVLAIIFVLLWLMADYLRQRAYFKQLLEAIARSGELQASSIVRSVVTKEQQLVTQLLEEQHRSYLNELGKYRRQQEFHNHFVLQWVHHMKTPVSVIDLLAQEALQKPSLQEEEKQLVVSIHEESDRLTRGLEMMLYTARLDKFEIDLHSKKIPLHELIRTVINAHKRLCIRHSIFPRIDGELWVETDEKWMTFVLNQFVSNAIKYSKSKAGSKSIVFHLLSHEHGGGVLEVRDEGIGIASYDLPRIFDPFFTGENGRVEGESTGMGLYLVKQVCNRLGHVLGVSSEIGEGSTFTITFEPRGIHRLNSEAKESNRLK